MPLRTLMHEATSNWLTTAKCKLRTTIFHLQLFVYVKKLYLLIIGPKYNFENKNRSSQFAVRSSFPRRMSALENINLLEFDSVTKTVPAEKWSRICDFPHLDQTIAIIIRSSP